MKVCEESINTATLFVLVKAKKVAEKRLKGKTATENKDLRLYQKQLKTA